MMNAIITQTLKKDQIRELFEQESFFMFSQDVIPEYRVIELFGESFAEWLDSCCSFEGYMKGGSDYKLCGDGSDRMMRYFYLPGFLKIVSKHNEKILRELHSQSGAGLIVNQIYDRKREELDRLDREEELKREERRRKRAEARAKKAQQ